MKIKERGFPLLWEITRYVKHVNIVFFNGDEIMEMRNVNTSPKI